MEEIWEVYDKFREKTGKVIQRNSNERLKDGEYHLVITGIIQNSKKQILITKRKTDKPLYGGLWECTSGSVIKGETTINATIREIYEEIGIVCEESEARFLGTIKEKDYFRDVWLFKKDIYPEEISFNDGEVVNACWVSVEKYKELIEKNIIVPSGKKIIDMIERDMEVEI